MAEARIEIAPALTVEEGLPRPQWDVLAGWVTSRVPPEQHTSAWTDISRQWLSALGAALSSPYDIEESETCLLLAPRQERALAPLLKFVERCREGLQAGLPGIVDFQTPGKQVILVLKNQAAYYQYISAYYPEGRYGGSGGITVRQGFQHVVAWGTNIDFLVTILAHELTHAALSHRSMPQWLEEGLAQHFEHEIAGRPRLHVDDRTGRRHRRYWGRFGLEQFWGGKGFHRAGKIQGLSYQLAEIVVRLMLDDCRPRWLGFGRNRQRALFGFLHDADAADAGESAHTRHFGCSLATRPAQFLGPGDWTPRMTGQDIFTSADDSPLA